MMFYYYEEQRQAVMALMMLLEFRLFRSTPVKEANHIRSSSGEAGVFIVVEDHGCQIPEDILEAARHAGMMQLKLSDEWARERCARGEY